MIASIELLDRRASMRSSSRLAPLRLRALLHPQPVHLARELVAELLEQVLAQQLLLQRRRARAPRPPRGGSSGGCCTCRGRARRSTPGGRAEYMMKPAPHTPHFVRPENRYCGRRSWLKRFAARPTSHCRAARWRVASAPLSTARRRRCAAAGTSLDDPLRWRVRPRDALAGVRILHVAQPVPDQAADVQLVVQDAGAALRVAVDRARAPQRRRTGRATPSRFRFFAICFGDTPADEVAEDALDDRGLFRHRSRARPS